MTRFGYTLMTEQAGPKALVDHAVSAERAGFDFEVCSDHFSPWLAGQGHAPNAWAVLGAVAQATSEAELYSYVTCPTMRYHPAVVAQQAATVQLLSDGRFTLGLGSGENLNEHIIGEGWPNARRRQDMLAEAAAIIRALLDGETVNRRGEFFNVDQARLWDPPQTPVGIAIAMSGRNAVKRFTPLSDQLVSTSPDAAVVERWYDERAAAGLDGGAGVVGQIPICWDRDRDAAVQRAHEQFRWFLGGWPVNAELPTPATFAAATKAVRPEDVASQIACGPDLDAIVDRVREYWEAGFTHVALVQIGNEDAQEMFFAEAATPLLAALKNAAPAAAA